MEAGLVRAYWDRVRLFALRRLSDRSAAEDVAQETLRRVLEAVRGDRIVNPAALASFVFGTAHRLCQQDHRSRGREERALVRVSADPVATGPADPLIALVSEERRRAVLAALDLLPASDRELLRSLYFEHVDADSLAGRLAVSPGALRVRKHRALRRLSELLGDDAA